MENTIQNVYINSTGIFLPGDPIPTSEMTQYLGVPDNEQDRIKSRKIMKVICNQNGIRFRHYALDKNGHPTHLNADLAERAVIQALNDSDLSLTDIELLSVGSSMGDWLLPGFGNLVHRKLGGGSLGMFNSAGVCGSGQGALQSAWLAIRAGLHKNAIAVGSERSSAVLKASRFKHLPNTTARDKRDYFEADFLRYMLADGAGAIVLQNAPRKGLALLVEWVENQSYTGAYDICMTCGTKDPAALEPGKSWLDKPTVTEAEKEGWMVFRQNLDHLREHICDIVVAEMKRLINSGKLVDSEIDHYLPHISSLYFDAKLQDALLNAGINIPREKWFINLTERGNIGGAGIFVTLHDLLRSGRLKPNDAVVMLLPESSTSTIGISKFRVVVS